MDTNEIRQRAEAATPSPWEVGIVDPEIDPVEWFRQHLSFSESTDVWCVWCPQHPRADGEHSVLSAITGNGPDSEANAYLIANARRYVITLLDRITELEAERHYLQWFHMAADFGPADYDVIVAMQEQYEKVSGKPVPEDWRYKDEE